MLLIFTILLVLVTATRSQQPATINVDRDWKIPEMTKIGTIVKSVDVQGENDAKILFSLSLEDFSNPNQKNPFWIHPHTVRKLFILIGTIDLYSF